METGRSRGLGVLGSWRATWGLLGPGVLESWGRAVVTQSSLAAGKINQRIFAFSWRCQGHFLFGSRDHAVELVVELLVECYYRCEMKNLVSILAFLGFEETSLHERVS